MDLGGTYQLKNIQTVLAAEKILDDLGIKINKENKKNALSNVKNITGLRGRWDIVSKNPTIIYDVAHNKDGISAVLKQLNSFDNNGQLHFIMGFVNDKDIHAMLDLLPTNAQYYFTNAHIPRALSKELLAETALKKNLIGNCFDDVNEAIREAKKQAKINDVIIVCGSFFILSEIEPF